MEIYPMVSYIVIIHSLSSCNWNCFTYCSFIWSYFSFCFNLDVIGCLHLVIRTQNPRNEKKSYCKHCSKWCRWKYHWLYSMGWLWLPTNELRLSRQCCWTKYFDHYTCFVQTKLRYLLTIYALIWEIFYHFISYFFSLTFDFFWTSWNTKFVHCLEWI